MHTNIKKVVMAALFAALTCVSTIVIQVPSPMSGYVNLGDGFVILSGFFLGPAYGGCAAGLGSALADLFSGYAYYAPGTFVIKLAMAVVAALLLRRVQKANLFLGMFSGAVAAEIIMVLGYFAFAALLLGKGIAAAASIPGNMVQGIFGIIVAVFLYPAVQRLKNK